MAQPTHDPSALTAADLPHQRGAPQQDIAMEGIAALDELGARMESAVRRLSDADMHRPSALPEWTRAHLVSHLARNADALVNLLEWARTDITSPAYASDEDRAADIAEGAHRLATVIKEDLAAANARFRTTAEAMPASAWSNTVSNRQGVEMPGCLIPWIRVMEQLVHLVDLDVGYDFDEFADLPTETLDKVIQVILGSYRGIEGTPSVRLRAVFPDQTREYLLGSTAEDYQLAGKATDILGWLTARADGSRLTGTLPPMPSWLS